MPEQVQSSRREQGSRREAKQPDQFHITPPKTPEQVQLYEQAAAATPGVVIEVFNSPEAPIIVGFG